MAELTSALIGNADTGCQRTVQQHFITTSQRGQTELHNTLPPSEKKVPRSEDPQAGEKMCGSAHSMHAMLHRGSGPTRTIEELRAIMQAVARSVSDSGLA